jgi:predicted metal-dependent hydrolase
MTSAYISIRGMEIEVTYKPIKNLHIGVYPPFGKVRVAAPTRMTDDQVRLAVIQRLTWIKRHQQQLRDAARQTPREMVTGESHFVWGARYRLKVVERPGKAAIQIDGSRLVITVREGTSSETKLRLLQDWQRAELRARLESLIVKWEPVIGRSVPHWSIRKMKTKWGSCNPLTGHIWFNLELAKKDPRCVEYIVVHEMTHLLERGHNDRFVELMDGFMPDWRQRRDDLNGAPLAHENWPG